MWYIVACGLREVSGYPNPKEKPAVQTIHKEATYQQYLIGAPTVLVNV